MTDRTRQVVQATGHLREVLERTAEALAAADLEALLRSEVDLALAITNVTPSRALTPDDRVAIRAEVEGLQQALVRCRRLGGVLLDVVRVSQEAQGRMPAYGRGDAAASPRRVDTRG
jgi:hypothetical protein